MYSRRRFSSFILVSTLLILAGCQSAPQKMDTVKEGEWMARALVQDKKHAHSFIINLDFNAIRDRALRLDVTSTLGQPVASLVSTPAKVSYVLFRSKSFYSGKPSPRALKPILAIPLDPRWIDNILFEKPFDAKSWTCTKDDQGFLKECDDSVTQVQVKWNSRSGERRTVDINHSAAEVQINLHTFRPKVQDRENLFKLKAPKGFKRFILR